MRPVVVGLSALALLGGLVVAWPQLASGAREPLVGDWVPDQDPGVVLRVEVDGRRERVAFGERWHQVLWHGAPDRSPRLTAEVVHPEGALVRRWSKHLHTAGRRELSGSASGGYRRGQRGQFTFDYGGGDAVERVLFAPIRLQPAPTREPRVLVELPDLGLQVRWQQTAGALRLELAPLGDRRPRLAGGLLQLGDQRAPIERGAQGYAAELPLAGLDRAPADTHTGVLVQVGGAGITVEVEVKVP